MKESRARKQPAAFTLIELLAVIAIIGLLVGLLLPAVQSAREASRRSACSNKMKQIGIAIHSYENARKELPMATTYYNPGTLNTTNSLNTLWSVVVMPFLELSDIYDRIDFGLQYFNPPNWGLLHVQPPGPHRYTVQQCPSNPYASTGEMLGAPGVYLAGSGTSGAATSGGRSYDMSLGPASLSSMPADCPLASPPASYCNLSTNYWCAYFAGTTGKDFTCTPGVANPRYKVAIALHQIPDGVSKTFLLLERRPELCLYSGLYNSIMVGVTTALRPNSALINTSVTTTDPSQVTNSGASSLHTGGIVNVVMVDGAVRVVKDSIAFDVYNYLGNRSDGKSPEVP